MLKPAKFRMLTPQHLRPEGWLKRQLEIETEGLCGHLDQIWPDIRDSKWIGGNREGWERVPYWLDGFIPLAWLLDDEGLKARAKRYVDAILAGQQEDGWLCPCTPEERGRYDMWALFLIGKVLALYADCSGDERVEEALCRAFWNYRGHLQSHTLFDWAAARWYEALIPLFWLYERRPEGWILEMAHTLAAEGLDYQQLYRTLPMDKAAEHPHWSYPDHVVNTAMALKSRALYSRLTGEDPGAFAKEMLAVLMKKHGMAAGHFTGDECLAGNSPIQGSECCGVVEAMYSYEQLLSLTGDPFWGDRLEQAAFNALPATLSPDMWTHQYDQLTNQPACVRIPDKDVHFTSNGGESHLFGLEPNYGCCTANFGQGWPKFALSAMMRAEEGPAVTALVPAAAEFSVDGAAGRVEVRTEYPFRDTAEIIVTADAPAEFTLLVRIPGFAASARLCGRPEEPGAFARLRRRWEGESRLLLELAFETELVKRPGGLTAVRRGPLVYSAAIAEKWERREYTRDGVERKFPYCDYEILPQSPWNYALLSDRFRLELRPVGECPFSPEGAPAELWAVMAPIPWSSKNGICSPVPDSLEPEGEPREVRMIPYGCTNLRMTELPYLGG